MKWWRGKILVIITILLDVESSIYGTHANFFSHVRLSVTGEEAGLNASWDRDGRHKQLVVDWKVFLVQKLGLPTNYVFPIGWGHFS